jgi:hypothetical protein
LTLVLPTEKTPPSLSAITAKVLLFGPPKIGKTTLAGLLNPDHTLILATEAGQGALEAYIQPVTSWSAFRDVYVQLSTTEHHYKTVVIDTVDLLHKMATDEAMKELGLQHPSDAGYGKGWRAVSDKFELGIGALANMGLGLWFISHAKDVEIKQRVGTVTKSVPSTGGRDWLQGFADHIFYLTSMETAEGEARALYTDASEYWEAGSRLPAVRAAGPIILPEDDPAGPVRALLGV